MNRENVFLNKANSYKLDNFNQLKEGKLGKTKYTDVYTIKAHIESRHIGHTCLRNALF